MYLSQTGVMPNHRPPDVQGMCSPSGVSPPGHRLSAILDEMRVEQLWQADYPSDWRTGQIVGARETTPGGHTHCSTFVAAVADRLGLYILRPPEHGQNWLADAQERWLNGAFGGLVDARKAGWRRIGRLAEPRASKRAVARANEGHLVMAIYNEPPVGTRQISGHVAIVRPSTKVARLVHDEGPDVTQAGVHNHRIVPMRAGFVSHMIAWCTGKIEYFYNESVT
jgi:hypothetical protein